MEAILRPVDAARVRALHALGPIARALAADRDRRVAVSAALAAAFALVVVVGAPMWTIAIAPVVLGVPHVVADIRYLVVRQGLHRDRALAIVAGAPLVVAAFGGGLRAALVAVAGAALLTSARRRRLSLPLVAVLGGATLLAWRSPAACDAAFAQLHNLVAIVLWWAWRPAGERPVWRWLGLAAITTGALAILSGVLDPLVDTGLGWGSHARGLDVGSLADSLAPGLQTRWALRLVLLFAYGQSVHYAIWLRLIPDEDRARATPRGFAASMRALRADLGPFLLGAAIVLSVVVVGWGAFDVVAARDAYVRFSVFHGYVEIVVLGLAVARGRLRV